MFELLKKIVSQSMSRMEKVLFCNKCMKQFEHGVDKAISTICGHLICSGIETSPQNNQQISPQPIVVQLLRVQ